MLITVLLRETINCNASDCPGLYLVTELYSGISMLVVCVEFCHSGGGIVRASGPATFDCMLDEPSKHVSADMSPSQRKPKY